MMMKLQKLIMCFALVLCLMHATSKPIVKKDRVYHEVPLSNREHDDSQNFDYDHDAFLGQEEARTFDHLAPVESKNRLGMLVERIDEDKDGYVTVEEMKKWIKQVQNRWIYEDVDRHWKRYELDGDGLVSWEEYKNYSTSRLMHVDPYHNDGFIAREERRFKKADLDADMKVNKEEFAAILHPEQYDQMKDLLVLETLEDIDKNKDGYIDLDEYIGDMYKYAGDQVMGNPDEHVWLKTTKEHFAEFRDKNKDGKMDMEEIRDWILPNTDYAGAEAKHLVLMSDADRDGRLTRTEIMNKYNLFVGSMATDFGQALHHPHDEF